jgi:ABC-type glycerol-3-phosphate transport system permease component
MTVLNATVDPFRAEADKHIKQQRRRNAAVRVPHYFVLFVIGVLALFPMYFMAITGLKNGIQLQENPFNIAIAHPFGTFYALAWNYLAGDLLRTALIVVASVFGILVLGMMSAYAFARMEFFGSTFLFYAIFGLLLIPSFLTLIPLFLEVKGMGLLDNPLALILPYIAGGQALAIFVFRSSIRGIPEELFEAARVDGASHMRMLLRIVTPLSRPIMIAIALINITAFWGDYVFPSLVLGIPQSTAAMAIGNFQQPVSVPDINVVNMQFAAYTIVSIPIIILFIIFMKYFISGMASGGAVKM